MRGTMKTPGRGASLLLEHMNALASDGDHPRRPPFERLSEQIGPALAELLVQALAGDHGMRRRGRRA